MTVVPLKALSQINVFPNVVLKIRVQRIVGHLLIAALLIEHPRIDSFLIESLRIDILRNDHLLIAGPPLIVVPLRAALQATVLQIVVQEIRARVTVGLPSIVDRQSIGPQIASQIGPQIVSLWIGP